MNEIVVGVDGSEESRGALAWAVEEGRLRQAPVLAIHAWELPMVPAPTGLVPPSVEVASDLTELRQGSAELVESMVREIAADAPDVEVRPLAVEDGPVNALLAAAEQNDAQMIVVGSRGHGGFVALLRVDERPGRATCDVPGVDPPAAARLIPAHHVAERPRLRARYARLGSRDASSRPIRCGGRVRPGVATKRRTSGSSAARTSRRARRACHEDVTITTSSAPICRAAAATARALPAVVRASPSATSRTAGPRHARRISSASEGRWRRREKPDRRTSSAPSAGPSAATRRAAQIGWRPS